MTKVNTSAVVLIPPENLWAPIQAIREKYDRNVRRWMPHITLLYPFRPEIEFKSLESDFKKVCKKCNSFEVKLENFNFFHHKKQSYTIWLEPKSDNQILNLQKEIQSLVPDCNDVSLFKKGFTPHLSVGQISGKEHLYKTLKKLTSHWSSIKFSVDSVFMIAREPHKNSVFKIKRIISLSK